MLLVQLISRLLRCVSHLLELLFGKHMKFHLDNDPGIFECYSEMVLAQRTKLFDNFLVAWKFHALFALLVYIIPVAAGIHYKVVALHVQSHSFRCNNNCCNQHRKLSKWRAPTICAAFSLLNVLKQTGLFLSLLLRSQCVYVVQRRHEAFA